MSNECYEHLLDKLSLNANDAFVAMIWGG